MYSEIKTATQFVKQIADADCTEHLLCSAMTLVEEGLKFDGFLVTTSTSGYFFSIIDPNFLASIIAPPL
jgi:hypothetical protein